MKTPLNIENKGVSINGIGVRPPLILIDVKFGAIANQILFRHIREL